MEQSATFDESEIREAERHLEASLQADDPTAWVYNYTEDAVFDGGGEHAVEGAMHCSRWRDPCALWRRSRSGRFAPRAVAT